MHTLFFFKRHTHTKKILSLFHLVLFIRLSSQSPELRPDFGSILRTIESEFSENITTHSFSEESDVGDVMSDRTKKDDDEMLNKTKRSDDEMLNKTKMSAEGMLNKTKVNEEKLSKTKVNSK